MPAALPPALRKAAPWLACGAVFWTGWLTGDALFRPPPAPPGPAGIAVVRPTDELAAALIRRTNAAWGRIESELRRKAPRTFAALRPPADPAALAGLERRLGLTLPPAVRASLGRHDGLAPGFPLGGARPLSVEEMHVRLDGLDDSLRDDLFWHPRGLAELNGTGDLSEWVQSPAVLPVAVGGDFGAVPRSPHETSELLCDLRTGRLWSAYDSTGYPLGDYERRGAPPRGWADELERHAAVLEGAPAGSALFEDGRYDGAPWE